MLKAANKPIIAVDVDDVIAAHAPALVAYSNRRWGTNLTLDNYHEHWGNMWQVDHQEWQNRTDEYFSSGHIESYDSINGASEVLKKLSRNYKLVVVTARMASIDKPTREWVTKYYPGVFTEIYLTNLWSGSNKDDINRTKADFLKSIKAEYFIDDQLKHVLAAAEIGIKSLLFGCYPWNQTDGLPACATRVKDWPAVLEYFDGRS